MTVDRWAVQAVLRTWFAQWGLPAQLRVDNGAPWGSWSERPPDLALWLLGLGSAIVWHRPRHRQGHAVVERAHGGCQRWVEPATCPSAGVLQARLDYFTTLQRERYPAIAGQSRLAAYPALADGGQPYAPDHEDAQGDVRRVWAVLGRRVWVRRVDKVGRISLANRAVAVGRAAAGQEVTVRLVIHDDAPVGSMRDPQGPLLRQQPAPELARERILALEVSRRRPRRRRGQPRVHHEG